MAMNASSLANEIKAAVNAIDIENGSVANDDVIAALAEAIVNHITSNAKANVASGSSAGQWPII